MVITIAFSNERLVSRSRGLMLLSMQILMASATLEHSRLLVGEAAGADEEPGRLRPIDSMAVAMVFAVYIPPQAPAPGHAWRSISSMISSFVLVTSPPSDGWTNVL